MTAQGATVYPYCQLDGKHCEADWRRQLGRCFKFLFGWRELQGKPFDTVVARAMDASFDERISLVSLLLAGLNTRFAAATATGAVTDACYQQLRSFKRTLTQQDDADPAALFAAQCENYRARLDTDKAAGALLPDEAAARTRPLQ